MIEARTGGAKEERHLRTRKEFTTYSANPVYCPLVCRQHTIRSAAAAYGNFTRSHCHPFESTYFLQSLPQTRLSAVAACTSAAENVPGPSGKKRWTITRSVGQGEIEFALYFSLRVRLDCSSHR